MEDQIKYVIIME